MRHYDPNRHYEVEVRCSCEREFWTDREEAIEHYFMGAMACEGSASERYLRIAGELMEGRAIATDGIEPLGGWKE